jgi:hypothetical protein
MNKENKNSKGCVGSIFVILFVFLGYLILNNIGQRLYLLEEKLGTKHITLFDTAKEIIAGETPKSAETIIEN